MTNEEAKEFLDNLKICIEEHPVVADWLVEIADRKNTADAPQTETHDLRTETHECVKDTHDKTEQTERSE